MMRYLSLMMFAFLSFVFADDPAWYSDLTTQLTAIGVMLVATLGTVIGFNLAPLAWDKIKKVLNR